MGTRLCSCSGKPWQVPIVACILQLESPSNQIVDHLRPRIYTKGQKQPTELWSPVTLRWLSHDTSCPIPTKLGSIDTRCQLGLTDDSISANTSTRESRRRGRDVRQNRALPSRTSPGTADLHRYLSSAFPPIPAGRPTALPLLFADMEELIRHFVKIIDEPRGRFLIRHPNHSQSRPFCDK